MKDDELKALLIGIELEKVTNRNDTPEANASRELRELEHAQRTSKRLKSELAFILHEGNMWDEVKASRLENKENKRKRKTLWFKIKKALGFTK